MYLQKRKHNQVPHSRRNIYDFQSLSACFSLSDKHCYIMYVCTYHYYEGTAPPSATFGLALIPGIQHQAVDPSESSLRLLMSYLLEVNGD